MKKHRNRHTSFIPMGNEIATPVTANTPTATQQQSIIANSTTTQNDDPELSLFLCSKLPQKRIRAINYNYFKPSTSKFVTTKLSNLYY